jgi:hypothetical protein
LPRVIEIYKGRQDEEKDVGSNWMTLKEKSGSWQLKQEAPDSTLCRIRFERGYGLAATQAT